MGAIIPFKSKSQRAYLFSEHPEVAKTFAAHTTPSQEKHLPEYAMDKKTPMHAVLESMGRAARDARSRRFTKKPAVAKISPEEEYEETGDDMRTSSPNPPSPGSDMAKIGHQPDISDEDMAEMMEGVQR